MVIHNLTKKKKESKNMRNKMVIKQLIAGDVLVKKKKRNTKILLNCENFET